MESLRGSHEASYPPPPAPNPYVHYKLEAGIHEAVFLTFKRHEARSSEARSSEDNDPGAVALESASGAAGSERNGLSAGGGGECHADAAAAALLSQEALARVKSVYSTYMSSPEPPKDDVSNEYNIAGHDPVRSFFNRDQCMKSLDPCLESAEIKSVALEEQAKFRK